MPIIKKHQTLADFVCQHAGTLNSIFEMALLNNIGITYEPDPGTELKVDVADKSVTAFFIKSELDIAGALSIGEPILGGIGYMQIGNDFKVS